MLPNTKSRLGRCVVACKILAKPLFDEHAKGCRGETENETCEPKAVDAYSGGRRREWCFGAREGYRRTRRSACDTKQSGPHNVFLDIHHNFAKKCCRLNVALRTGVGRLKIVIRLDEKSCQDSGEQAGLGKYRMC